MSNRQKTEREGPAEPDYWSLAEGEVLQAVGSSPDGLSEGEAAKRLAAYGRNTLKTKKQASIIVLFFSQLKSPIILILLFATIISAFLSDWIDAGIILLIILGSAALSLTQEYSANHAAEKLQSQVSARAVVLRGGQTLTIPAENVVPGDITLLSAGSLVPADGVVLD